MLCVIWYHLYNFKNVKNTYGGVLLLRKSQALKLQAVTKSNGPSWVFFTFFKLYKWYQIMQCIAFLDSFQRRVKRFLSQFLFLSNWDWFQSIVSVHCFVSYKNQSFVLFSKINDWFLYEK